MMVTRVDTNMVLENVHIDYYTELYTKFTRIFGQNKVN